MKLARPIISPILFSLFFLVFALGLFVAPNDAQAQPDAPLSFTPSAENIQAAPRAPGVVLVGLKPNATMSRSATGVQSNNATLNTRLARLGAQSVERVFPFVRQPRAVTAVGRDVDLTRIYRLRLAPNADVLRAVQELRADPSVAYAEPDYLAHVIATPNDPEFANQWGLTKINAPAAWDTTTGSNDVVIAVVDAGIDATHPDLSGQLWTNPGEIAGNGIDDDSDGYVDDIRGWNIIGNNADLSDNTGHGTQVAGVIAAATNNSAGIAGVCWNCRLMIVKVMQPSGVANYSDIATGVAYAAQKGAKVINLSLGGSSDSTTLKAAVASASSTAVIVGGAGNDNSSAAFYPAAYDDYVLAVAGTTDTDAKVGSSNYGTWVDVSAPGAAIRTTFSGGTYADSSGTSMAAPFAAGLAGLIRSQNPTWSANLTRAQIVNTTDNIDSANPGYAGKLGSGRINAQKAVTTAATPQLSVVSYTTNGVTSGTPAPGSTVNLIVTIRNTWGTVTNATGTLSTSDPYVTITGAATSYGNVDAYGTAANATPFAFSVSSSAPYAHAMSFSLTINGAGGVNVVLPLTITTENGTVQVSGFITSDTTWTNDRIYEILSNVQVNSGVTLTIQPGTQIRFRAGKIFQVAGTLVADGQQSNPIVFTSAVSKTNGAWGPINFASTAISATVDSSGNYISGSIIRNARVEYGTGIGILSTLPYINSNTFISNSATYVGGWQGCCDSAVVHYNDPGGMWGGGTISGTFAVRNSTFIGNQGAAVAVANVNGKKFEVTDNLIIDQMGAGVTQGNIGWYTSLIARNRLLRTHGLNILGTSSGTVIEDNYVANSTGPGYTAGYGVDIYSGSPIIRHNVFANSGQGQSWCNGRCSVINIFSGGTPTVISNTLTGNWLDSLIYFNWGGSGTYQYNNWAGNRVNYIFYRKSLDNTQNVTATLDYWGTTDTAAIDNLIYDFLDDFNPGQVFYQPLLTTPEPSAPAFLWNANVNPNPVGIQQTTFTLTFSRPMDQSSNPAVFFGATSPYTSYAVLDNAQWLSNTQWRATYDITSLVPRGTYTISVSSAKGTDGMEIPTDTRFAFTVDYAGQITDQTPPPPPTAFATGKPSDVSTVEATWSATDPESAITGYRYAIGSAAGTADIVNWTTTTATSMSRSGLGLVAGRQYWFAVQAKNAGGLWSAGTNRSFVAGQQSQTGLYLPFISR
jgi:subtilisin family serine protease